MMPTPEIDMSNFEGVGTLLYPIFKKFFHRAPGSIWRVNSAAMRQMKEAGIPEASIGAGVVLVIVAHTPLAYRQRLR
jgi:hypothetical protein